MPTPPKPTPDQQKLLKKYDEDKMNAIRQQFERDLRRWERIQTEQEADLQCLDTLRGPWPAAEWEARHSPGQTRPCLHEDVISQYHNQVINQIEANPLGPEVQPEGDGADEKTAEAREDRLRAIDYHQQGTLAYQQAVSDAVRGSYGFWKLETRRSRKGDGQYICIEPVMDPNSIIPGFWKKPDACDMQDAWELDIMPLTEFHRRWPNAQRIDWKAYSNTVGMAPMWIRGDDTIMVCAWWHFEDAERELLELDTPEGGVTVYSDDVPEDDLKKYETEGKIKKRTPEKNRKIFKTIMNGVEALDETEWPDPGDAIYGPEIPIMIVTGRVKYSKGERIIDSLTRKARIGQLLYDYVISQIQEMLALAPRTARLGPEGSFDTSTDWSPRSITATKEYKVTTNPQTGAPNPPPILEQYDVSGLQFLELAKTSILQGIQNAIGMTATERKDRAAKSGKALEALMQEMNVATAHYFNALRIAQERSYRIVNRVDEYLTNQTGGDLTFRDKFGKHRVEQVQPGYFKGRHAVVIGTGKLYQSQQDKDSDIADQLMAMKDPTIMLAVLPGALRMKGGGQFAQQLADMIEAMQPPQMQAAREGKEMPPMAMAAIQRANQALQAINEHAHELETKVIELEDERRAKVLELHNKTELAKMDNETKIAVAEINAAAKTSIDQLLAQVDAIKHVADVLTERFGIAHDATQNELDRQHEATQNELDRQHAIATMPAEEPAEETAQ